jgi:protease-4
MSDMAASGGYLIALPAHAIVAQPGTLTGSIGVLAGKVAIGGTLDRVGVNVEEVSTGRFAALNSPVRPYTAEEREKLLELMRATYDDFVRKTAEARGTTPEEIDAVAQGRVWTGRQALERGLIDELGGLTRAIALAKARAGIDTGADVSLVIYPPRRGLLEALSDPFGAAAAPLPMFRLLGSSERQALAALAAPLRRFRRGEVLAIMPSVVLR